MKMKPKIPNRLQVVIVVEVAMCTVLAAQGVKAKSDPFLPGGNRISPFPATNNTNANITLDDKGPFSPAINGTNTNVKPETDDKRPFSPDVNSTIPKSTPNGNLNRPSFFAATNFNVNDRTSHGADIFAFPESDQGGSSEKMSLQNNNRTTTDALKAMVEVDHRNVASKSTANLVCPLRKDTVAEFGVPSAACEFHHVFHRNTICRGIHKACQDQCGQSPHKDCSCLPDCTVYKSCCIGYHTDCPTNASVPKPWGYRETAMSEKVNCSPYINAMLISKCPDGFEDESNDGNDDDDDGDDDDDDVVSSEKFRILAACESSSKPTSPLELFPVTDSVTRHHFKNFACWKCWEMPGDNLFWSVDFVYDKDLKHHGDEQNLTAILETVVDNPKRAVWNSPNRYSIHRCDGCAIHTCTACHNPELQRICQKHSLPVSLNGVVYKNEQCIRCGHDRNKENFKCTHAPELLTSTQSLTSATGSFEISISIITGQDIFLHQRSTVYKGFLWERLDCPQAIQTNFNLTPSDQEGTKANSSLICSASKCQDNSYRMEVESMMGRCQTKTPLEVKVTFCFDKNLLDDEKGVPCMFENNHLYAEDDSLNRLAGVIKNVSSLLRQKAISEWDSKNLKVTVTEHAIMLEEMMTMTSRDQMTQLDNVLCDTRLPLLLEWTSPSARHGLALTGLRLVMCASCTFSASSPFAFTNAPGTHCAIFFPDKETAGTANTATSGGGSGSLEARYSHLVIVFAFLSSLAVCFLPQRGDTYNFRYWLNK